MFISVDSHNNIYLYRYGGHEVLRARVCVRRVIKCLMTEESLDSCLKKVIGDVIDGNSNKHARGRYNNIANVSSISINIIISGLVKPISLPSINMFVQNSYTIFSCVCFLFDEQSFNLRAC